MMTLYQFPVSHYCEKVRWALDYKKLSYHKHNLLLGLHVHTTRKIAKKSYMPILQHEGKTIQESRYILDYLDDRFEAHNLTPQSKDSYAAVVAWERLADVDIGLSVRCFCYHHLLQHPKIVIPFFTKDTGWWAPLYMKLGFSRIKPIMRKMMKINADTARQSELTIEVALDKINQHLQGGRYLVDDRFTRADLCVAALLAPLFMPPQYGVDWPDAQQIPQAIQDFRERNADKLKFAEHIYQLHR